MKTQTVNLPFSVRLDTDGNGFSYVEDNRLSVSCYARNGEAVKRLKAGIAKEVSAALDRAANWRKLALMTKAGELFLVEYSGGWLYHIAGPGRAYSGSCSSADWKTLEDCAADARKHAESSFGGIAWECSI